MPRRLMLTVDVEAQSHRATEKHVDRLIWGEFAEGRAGIGEMMDIADRHGAGMTMFLDWAETDTHGEAIRDVGREIHRRGHDLQLHVHTDYFSTEFWDRKGVSYEINLNILSPEQADVIADEIAARQIEATGKAPLAFRGGGYRYSANLLNSLRRNGVALDTSVNVSRPTQPVDLSLSRQFRWSNGMIEVPVSNVAKYRNCPRPLDFNFNTAYFPDVGRMHEYLDNFWRERGEDAIAVLVMHSWSLLKLHDDGIFRHDGGRNMKRFDAFLSGLGRNIEFVTATDLIELDRASALPVDPEVSLDAFAEAQQRKTEGDREPDIAYRAPSSILPKAGYTSLSCPICGAAKERFVQLNGRKCPDCGSVERQRCFAIAYENAIRQRFDVAGKEVLIFSPSVSELRFLNSQGLASKRSADIRPEVKPDMVLDMCAMPSVESGSQEFVFASYLMPVVYDMGAALDEVERVLAPGGVFISIEPLQAGGPTQEIADPESRAGWYGKEVLEKYRVGSYRRLGEADYLAELERRFTVERFTARDPVTGQVNHTHLCRSRKPGSALRKLFKADAGRMGQIRALLGVGKVEPAEAYGSKEDLHKAAEALWNDEGNPESQKQSVELFHRLYDLGDKVRAGYRLGTAYYQGRGVARDLDRAYEYLSIPELDKTRFALYFRGLVLKDRTFSGRDETRALEALKSAQEMGVEAAAAHIASLGAATPPQAPETPQAPAFKRAPEVKCTICGHDLSATPTSEPNCPQCGARPRTRVFTDLMAQEIKPHVDCVGGFSSPLLAFAMTGMEEKILSTCFKSFKSVSLYGNYRSDHEKGVDARDLSRYPDGSFAGHFGILLFDYFPEHEKALAEAARVTADGGIFIHHINTARLLEGNEPPNATYTIQTRPGYFDYVPDSAAMPSVKVGVDWFTNAMREAGFHTRHIVMNDKHTGEAIHWFIGTRRARSGTEKAVEGSARSASADTVAKFDCAGERTTSVVPKTYSVPLFQLEDVTRLVLEVSIPPIPDSLRGCYFAEHVFDSVSQESTDQVIIVGNGKIGVSNDLGQTWKRIEPRRFEAIRFHNCFTTRYGKHIVQAYGWQGIGDTEQPEERHAQIFLFSPEWDLLGISKAGSAQWHGNASIAEKNGIVMYAEYHNNSAKYRSDFATSGLQHTVLPCAIWRSKDEGASWEKVFEQEPTQIRHFHTLMADPFERDVWWASSGDLSRESRVWRSADNGDTWVECTDPNPDIVVSKAFSSHRQSAHRFTDAAILKDQIVWGADDIMGAEGEYNPNLALERRAGSRIFRSCKGIPFSIKEVAYIGAPVRSMIDVDHGWIITTEAKYTYTGRRPSIFFLDNDLKEAVKICDIDNFRNRESAFTVSRSSRKARNGVFFSFRESYDLFEGNSRICMFKLNFIKD